MSNVTDINVRKNEIPTQTNDTNSRRVLDDNVQDFYGIVRGICNRTQEDIYCDFRVCDLESYGYDPEKKDHYVRFVETPVLFENGDTVISYDYEISPDVTQIIKKYFEDRYDFCYKDHLEYEINIDTHTTEDEDSVTSYVSVFRNEDGVLGSGCL
jgi:hypothetical protein